MSDARVTYIVDGKRASVPVANAAVAEELWKSKGKAFEITEAPAGEDPAKGVAVPSFVKQKPTGSLQRGQYDPASGMTALTEGQMAARRRAGDEAGIRGVVQGASMHFADEMQGLGAALAPDAVAEDPRHGAQPTAESKSAQFGRWLLGRGAPRSYTETRDAERAANALSQRVAPVKYGAGEFVGGMAPAIALGSLGGGAAAARGAGAMMQAGVGGGLVGGVSGLGGSEAQTLGGMARDTVINAGVGAGTGMLAEAVIPPVARWIANRARAGSRLVRAVGDEQKLAASGFERGTLKRLKQAHGKDAPARYAADAERLGIGRNRLGVIPATVRQHAADAEAVQEAARVAKNTIADEIADAPVDGRALADRVRAMRDEIGPTAGADLRKELDAIADAYEKRGIVPFREMNKERQTWGDKTNFAAESPRARLRQRVYGAISDTMEEAADTYRPLTADDVRAAIQPRQPLRGPVEVLDEEGYTIPASAEAPTLPRLDTVPPPRRASGAGAAPESSAILPPAAAEQPAPAIGRGRQWRDANWDEHVGITMGDAAENRLNTSGNRLFSPTDYVVGAAAGVGSGGNPVITGTALLANRAIRGREHAAAHLAARGTQRALGGAARAAEGVAAASPGAHAGMGAAVADPVYGAMLSRLKPEDRAFRVSVLNQTDPEFRARQRAAAHEREDENE